MDRRKLLGMAIGLGAIAASATFALKHSRPPRPRRVELVDDVVEQDEKARAVWLEKSVTEDGRSLTCQVFGTGLVKLSGNDLRRVETKEVVDLFKALRASPLIQVEDRKVSQNAVESWSLGDGDKSHLTVERGFQGSNTDYDAFAALYSGVCAAALRSKPIDASTVELATAAFVRGDLPSGQVSGSFWLEYYDQPTNASAAWFVRWTDLHFEARVEDSFAVEASDRPLTASLELTHDQAAKLTQLAAALPVVRSSGVSHDATGLDLVVNFRRQSAATAFTHGIGVGPFKFADAGFEPLVKELRELYRRASGDDPFDLLMRPKLKQPGASPEKAPSGLLEGQ